MKTLVLGLGNELYGDDAVGIYVIRRLREEKEAGRIPSTQKVQVDLEECCLTGLSILDVIIGYDDLIIVDTIKRENPRTGRISVLQEEDLRHIPGPSPHYVSIPQTIEIGRTIGLKVPRRITIIAVEAKNMYKLGEGLTQEMENALPEIIKKTKQAILSRGMK